MCSDAIGNFTMVWFFYLVRKKTFNLRDMGAFDVLIVCHQWCHLSVLITNKFYMIFNPANYDYSLNITFREVWNYLNLHQFILCAKTCHTAYAVIETCCTKMRHSTFFRVCFWSWFFRSSYQRCSTRKGVLKNSQIS